MIPFKFHKEITFASNLQKKMTLYFYQVMVLCTVLIQLTVLFLIISFNGHSYRCSYYSLLLNQKNMITKNVYEYFKFWIMSFKHCTVSWTPLCRTIFLMQWFINAFKISTIIILYYNGTSVLGWPKRDECSTLIGSLCSVYNVDRIVSTKYFMNISATFLIK